MKHLIVDGRTGEAKEVEIDETTLAAMRPTNEEIANQLFEQAQSLRRAAYIIESDPLFFGWQRAENSKEAWMDKVAEIRDRYPYPT